MYMSIISSSSSQFSYINKSSIISYLFLFLENILFFNNKYASVCISFIEYLIVSLLKKLSLQYKTKLNVSTTSYASAIYQ